MTTGKTIALARRTFVDKEQTAYKYRQMLLKQFMPIGRATGGDIRMEVLRVSLAIQSGETRELPTSLQLTWS